MTLANDTSLNCVLSHFRLPHARNRNTIRFPSALVAGRLAMTAVLAVLIGFLGNALALDPVPPPPPLNTPPEIVDFVGIEGAMAWTFEGQVLDESPVGLVITFGGLLSGHQVTVSDAAGYFEYEVQLQSSGVVTAHTVDDQQQGSNTASFTVN